MIETQDTVGAKNLPVEPAWTTAEPRKPLGYCFDAVLVQDAAGGYVASVAQLRGVVSQGDDVESALDNLVEAFRATIETYVAEGMPIPWIQPMAKQPGDTVRVAVNV